MKKENCNRSMKLGKLLKNVAFDTMWNALVRLYPEEKHLHSEYFNLYHTLHECSDDKKTSQGNLELRVLRLSDSVRIVMTHGYEFPIETLPGRNVVVDDSAAVITDKRLNDEEILAHVLYGVVIHGFETTEQYNGRIQTWLDTISKDPGFIPDDDWCESESDEVRPLRLIFLDIDGVLNTERHISKLRVAKQPCSDLYGPLFDPEAVENLREIIEKTHAKIVVTSSWRYIYGLEGLKEIWAYRKLPGKLFGVVKMDGSGTRGEEVENFVTDLFGDSANDYLILDDECEYSDNQLQRFIKVNPIRGIDSADVEKAIEILNLNRKKYEAKSEYEERKENSEERMLRHKMDKRSVFEHKMNFWAGVLYDDTPWDYVFILLILRRKLLFDLGYYQRYSHLGSGAQTIRYIKICVRLLDELIESPNDDKERKDKTFGLLWKIFERKMRGWWD